MAQVTVYMLILYPETLQHLLVLKGFFGGGGLSGLLYIRLCHVKTGTVCPLHAKLDVLYFCLLPK